ncbi:MAG: DUF192 domain-containing protein [Myxococcota bacterium]
MSTGGRIFTLLSLCWACNRTDAAPGPGSARSANVEAGAVATPSAAPVRPSTSVATASTAPTEPARPARCVVQLPEQAPPAAEPARNCPKDPGPIPQFERGYLSFKEAPNSPRLRVEVARTPDAHEHGLMYRTKMPEDQGMLFEWGVESRRVFWMHNTCLPLDMLFIARDGTVAGILEQVPVLNDAPRTVPCPASYVLEVNAGWCRRHGVKPGMRMTLE